MGQIIKRVLTTHALRIRLIELNNLHNIVHRTLPNQKFWRRPWTWVRVGIGYEMAWSRAGIGTRSLEYGLVVGTSCLGYEMALRYELTWVRLDWKPSTHDQPIFDLLWICSARSARLRLFGPILAANWAKLAHSPSFVALTLRNGLEYRNADRRVDSGSRYSVLLRATPPCRAGYTPGFAVHF